MIAGWSKKITINWFPKINYEFRQQLQQANETIYSLFLYSPVHATEVMWHKGSYSELPNYFQWSGITRLVTIITPTWVFLQIEKIIHKSFTQ